MTDVPHIGIDIIYGRDACFVAVAGKQQQEKTTEKERILLHDFICYLVKLKNDAKIGGKD
jgi:hypothetical protein